MGRQLRMPGGRLYRLLVEQVRERKTMRQFIINRIKEPSTWVAVSAIAALFGAPVGSVDAVHQIVAGMAALLGVLLPENRHVQ